jgi:para-aminobenzoate synthetase component 1
MSDFFSIQLEVNQAFKTQLLQWASKFSTFSFLDSNDTRDAHSRYDFILAADALAFYTSLEELPKDKFLFGHFGYHFNTEHKGREPFIDYRKCHFFEPRYVIYARQGRLYFNRNAPESLEILDIILAQTLVDNRLPKIDFYARTSDNQYSENILEIQRAIRNGQFYELNYCIEFYKEKVHIHPVQTFLEINQAAGAPMSALVKYNDKWVLSFSPERLAKLNGNKLISQPMKGTARRDLINITHDEQIKQELAHSIKERAENTMIVDLVRHDMTRYAHTGSIRVEEWCQVYSFPFVHQMISTISAELQDINDSHNALKALLPAGSMTGAPKKEVIQFIEKIENFGRGLYAGNIGYFAPDGNFDFNVVIRSLYYDEKAEKISLAVGGAITLLSDPEKEYQECLIKAEGILKFFK